MVTIGLGLYNNEEVITRTLDAIVLNINYVKEVILNDNGSTDGTGKICREYVSKYPEKIKYVCHKKNRGVMFHLFYFYRYPITTKYFIFMRANSFISENYVKTMLEKAKHEPNAALFYPMLYYCRTVTYHYYFNKISYIDMVATDDMPYNRMINCLKSRSRYQQWQEILYSSLYRTDYLKDVIREVKQDLGYSIKKDYTYIDIAHEDVFFIRLLAKGKFIGVSNVIAYTIKRKVESQFEMNRRYKKALKQPYLKQNNSATLFRDFKNNIMSKIEQKPLNWEREFFDSFRANYVDFYGDYRDTMLLKFLRYIVSNIEFYIGNNRRNIELISSHSQITKLIALMEDDSILKTLAYNNIKIVGVYGHGDFCRHLCYKLNKSEYNPYYIIRSDNMDYNKDNSRVIDISDINNIYQVDAIIIAPATIFDNEKVRIREQLSENSNVRIVSIWEVIECAFARNKYGVEVKFVD